MCLVSAARDKRGMRCARALESFFIPSSFIRLCVAPYEQPGTPLQVFFSPCPAGPVSRGAFRSHPPPISDFLFVISLFPLAQFFFFPVFDPAESHFSLLSFSTLRALFLVRSPPCEVRIVSKLPGWQHLICFVRSLHTASFHLPLSPRIPQASSFASLMPLLALPLLRFLFFVFLFFFFCGLRIFLLLSAIRFSFSPPCSRLSSSQAVTVSRRPGDVGFRVMAVGFSPPSYVSLPLFEQAARHSIALVMPLLFCGRR